MNFVLDSTTGVLILYIELKIVNCLAEKFRWETLRNGVYGENAVSHTRTHARIHTWAQPSTHTPANGDDHTCTYTHMDVTTYTHIHTHMHHIHVHAHTHTHGYDHIRT